MTVDRRYLIRQRETWFCVVEVPRSLRDKLGNRIKRTLKTRDINVARARRFRVVADIKAAIEEARKGKAGDPVMQEALAFREALIAAEAEEALIAAEARGDAEHFGSADVVRGQLSDRYEALARRADTAPRAEAFLGIALGRATPVALHVETWLAEGSLKSTALRERTKTERRKAVAKFAAWLERVKLPATLEAVPRRIAGRYVSEELLPSGRDPVTVAKSVRSLASYWRWLQRRGHLPDDARDPWSGQAPAKSAKDGTGAAEERAFTDAEVARLLAGKANPTLAEFMLTGALTGLRREEIGHLRIADCADGVFVVQGGKTAAARRRAPIHPELVSLVARRAKGKPADAFLFHEFGPDNPERTDPIGKAFTRYRRSLGIQDGTGRRSLVNFHSFRRWWITSAVNAGQPPHIVSLIAGHTEGRKGMTLGRYWQGAQDDALRACVEAVRLPSGGG